MLLKLRGISYIFLLITLIIPVLIIRSDLDELDRIWMNLEIQLTTRGHFTLLN